MRLALQIFRKDVERLWWAILLTFMLLTAFAFHDTPTPVDVLQLRAIPQNSNWLTLVLPFAWSLLIALVIHQDPLTGDRQFWVALPSGWKPLAIAKTLFIVAFIQIPYFLSMAAILLSRGFNPLEHLPHLFWKQLVLLALVVPAMAVAVVVKNFAQFMLVPLSVIAALMFLSNRINDGFQRDEVWDMRWRVAMVILIAGALVIVALQFAARRTMLSRAIGITTAIIAASVYSGISRDTSAAINAELHPAPLGRAAISIALAPPAPSLYGYSRYYSFQRTSVVIPIAFSGLSPNVETRFDQISLELSRPDGERYPAIWPRSREDSRKMKLTSFLPPQDSEGRAGMGIQFFDPALWDRVRGGSATLHGRMLAKFYRRGDRVALPPDTRTAVGDRGFCLARTSSVNSAIRVAALECESPETSPQDMLLSESGGRGARFQQPYLWEGNAFMRGPFPQDPWLSPLKRGQTRALMFAETWSVRPLTQIGTEIVDYTIPNLDLNSFVVSAPVRPGAPK